MDMSLIFLKFLVEFLKDLRLGLFFVSYLSMIFQLLINFYFAYETNIYFDASDTIKLQKNMNWELGYVKKWLEANKFALNIEKANYVIFHSPVKKITEPIITKFGRKHISRSDNVKFLGVLLAETLSWRSHLVELSRKLARSVGMFYKLRHFVPFKTLKAVYCALFYPFLSYGATVWGATCGQNLKPVLVSQKKVVGAMTFSDPFAHTLPLFSDLQILNLIIYIIFMFPPLSMNVITILPQTILVIILPRCLIFITTILEASASHGDFFLKRKNTLQYGLRSVCLNGAKIWNNIPLDTRNSPSVGNFKKKIKRLLLESYNSEA